MTTLLNIFFCVILQRISNANSNLHNIVPMLGNIEITHGTEECPVGYFRCNASEQCVAQRLNCDGSVDCDDGSDEWDCADKGDTLFWDHLFRKQPYARSDDIPIGSCYWDKIEVDCLCRGNEIPCRFQELKELPKNLPQHDMEMLDLTGNHFHDIDENFFNDLTEVKILVLKFCSIESLESNSFRKINEIFLETLYLDENKIEEIPPNLFPENSWLQILILTGNRIKTLHSYDFEHLEFLRELDLRNNEIETFNSSVFYPLRRLETLFLNDNKIEKICPDMIPPLPGLQILSLAHNKIWEISRNSFNLQSLQHLFLSGNRLSTIRNRTFVGLPSLMGLNLDDNEISEFELEAFYGIENLTSLLLSGNKFTTLDPRILGNLTRLNYIYFSWFHLCRAALHVRVCEPKGDGISSTRHLLDNPVLRASVWVMATIGIIGNLIVLFGRYFGSSRIAQVEHSIYLRHLAASDLLMGIYLAVIATADILFRGEYIIHEEAWRQSVACATCGFLSTLSFQSSTLLLTLVTWDRLVAVTRPLQPRTSGRAVLVLRLLFLWGASFTAAGAPLTATDYFGKHFYGNNGVCLSLHIHDPFAKGWEYSAGLFIFINAFSLIFIIVAYLKMLQAIRGSGEAMRSTLSGRENIVARRFAIIVATDCACWLPIIIVKLAALGGIKISSALYAWLAVLVLPVNSALNPVLYTLTTPMFKQQLKKYFYTLSPCSASVESRSQTGYESGLSVSLGHFSSNSGRKRLLQRRVSFV